MARNARIFSGILTKNRRGYGFVILNDKDVTGGKDVFISSEDMSTAMDGDSVSVRITSGPGSLGQNAEGRIEKILSRSDKEIVGTFRKKGAVAYVAPEIGKQGETVLVHKQNYKGARSGDMVVVKIIRWPSPINPALGKVTEIISRKDEADGGIRALMRTYAVKEAFPKKAVCEAVSCPDTLIAIDYKGRKDLRDKCIFTIDGADAKDFDDAVSIERLNNGNYLLGVHIADVSHYVKEGCDLDKEAVKRGTSIYLPDRVIPMLPRELSNGICSLNPKEDRLTLSVDMEIDDNGTVRGYNIYESIIASNERLTYTDVSDILEYRDKELTERHKGVLSDLYQMQALAGVLGIKRRNRGSLDFDLDETHITVDEEGMPISVDAAERRTANRIIEEFMIAANETIAEHYMRMDIPFIFRVHEKPDMQKIEEFRRFIQSFGLNIKGSIENIHPGMLNDILEQVKGKAEEHVVNTLMLRSMKKAYYGTKCMGHFGLGTAFYCHFTAPIRRYPDLFIHRIIKEALKGNLYGSRIKRLRKIAEEVSISSSLTERRSDELVRDAEKLKKAQYMVNYLGEEYEGIISGVASFGFFVDIGRTIEGVVRLESLKDDYYNLDAEKYRFVGETGRNIYALGQKVLIKVESVDVNKAEINFIMAAGSSGRGSRRRGSKGVKL